MQPEQLRGMVRRFVSYGLIASMVAAPFLALLYGLGMGLLVMTVALCLTIYAALEALRMADPRVRARIQALIALNAVLAVICGIGAVVLLL